MAGRYVVLEFDDRDAAEAFVTNPNLGDQLGFRATAMFLKPKRYCECPPPSRGRKLEDHVKHPKYGLYVCTRCRRPSPHHASGLLERLRYVFGFSILEG